jgi:ribose transport system ATP-binding protein
VAEAESQTRVSAPPALLVGEGLSKSFFGVPVLRNVSFQTFPGRVLGLVGENGAGKSTLMNILVGNLRADEGAMTLNGAPYRPKDARHAEDHGVVLVHQELNLFPNLTVAENLLLRRFPRRGPLIRRGETRRLAAELLERVGLETHPDTPVDRLSAGERQLVEIAAALGSRPRLLILDEPTTSLSARETRRLFELIRQSREAGIAIIYISHALADVLRISDHLLVLRDGEAVASGPASEFNPDRLVSLMVGRQLTRLFPERRGAPRDEVLFSLANGRHPGVLRESSLSIRRGEVLGLFGLMGAGRTELARMLFGLDPMSDGKVLLEGRELRGGPRQRARAGLAFLTEDRRLEGLCAEGSVADNIALATLSRRARGPFRWLDAAGLAADVARARESVRLQTRLRDDQPVRTLSGGNQQKVVLARWLLAEPRVLILDEPTRGIDVGAKFDIYQLILDLADAGAGVLVISSELEELMGLCDRILAMSRGRVTGEFHRTDFNAEAILRAALAEVR